MDVLTTDGMPLPVMVPVNRWFAVNTLPGNEDRARINLDRQGWPCFCPQVSKTTRSGRRLMTRLRPLFPGYIFISLDPRHARWRSVDSTFGVRAIVKSGDTPAPLPVGWIEALQEITGSDGRVNFAPTLRPGENVTFMSGPFAGFIGRLEHLDAAGRVTVLLDLLGRTTPIKAQASELRAASTGPAI